MNAFVTVFYDWSRIVAGWFSWAAPLAVRITVGVVFMGTGWTKLHNLPANPLYYLTLLLNFLLPWGF